MVWLESELVAERENGQLASLVLLTKMANEAIPNMAVKGTATRKAAQTFAKQAKALIGEAQWRATKR